MHREYVSFELLFTVKEAVLSKRGKYTSVSIGICGPRGKVGEPALPWRRIYVFIPNGATFHRVTSETRKVSPLVSDALIQPIQPLILMASAAVPFKQAGPNPEVYASTEAWPQTPVHFVAVRRLGGLQMAQLEVCPFQYFPAIRKLDLVQEMAVKIDLGRTVKPPAPAPCSAALMQFKHRMAERVRKMVINPEHTDYRC